MFPRSARHFRETADIMHDWSFHIYSSESSNMAESRWRGRTSRPRNDTVVGAFVPPFLLPNLCPSVHSSCSGFSFTCVLPLPGDANNLAFCASSDLNFPAADGMSFHVLGVLLGSSRSSKTLVRTSRLFRIVYSFVDTTDCTTARVQCFVLCLSFFRPTLDGSCPSRWWWWNVWRRGSLPPLDWCRPPARIRTSLLVVYRRTERKTFLHWIGKFSKEMRILVEERGFRSLSRIG